MGNRSFEKWDTKGRSLRFKSGHRYCRHKGNKEPYTCSNKRIQKAKGRRGLYYVFCESNVPCSCQSIYPKILRIPIEGREEDEWRSMCMFKEKSLRQRTRNSLI